jgi:hypothetical protein
MSGDVDDPGLDVESGASDEDRPDEPAIDPPDDEPEDEA